jgi:hypothetical protein
MRDASAVAERAPLKEKTDDSADTGVYIPLGFTIDFSSSASVSATWAPHPRKN